MSKMKIKQVDETIFKRLEDIVNESLKIDFNGMQIKNMV